MPAALEPTLPIAALRALSRHPIAASVAVALDELLREDAWPSVERLDAVLGPRAGVRFERQERARRGTDVRQLYDGLIATGGVVPTREGSLHDVLNALVWASFPLGKRALHQRQFDVLRRHVPDGASRLPNARARTSDVLAMLDEGGLLILVPTAEVGRIEAALHDADLTRLSASLAATGSETAIFGHAILEHFAEDRPADPRASTLLVAAGALTDGVRPRLDALLAAMIADPRAFLAPTPWPAVPVRALFAGLAEARR